MSLTIDKKKLVLKNEQIIDFYQAKVSRFGNGAKLPCKKKYLKKGYKAYVVISR